MQTVMHMSFASAPGGGVVIDVCLDSTGECIVSLPLDHEGSLRTAAQVLHKAGVERAEFEGTQIQEMARP